MSMKPIGAERITSTLLKCECRESSVRFRQSYALLSYNPLPRFVQREKCCFFFGAQCRFIPKAC
jgi:hypothetical protein